MDERRARGLLGEAGRDVPVGGAPVDALVRRGRRSLWQRRAAPVLAVAVVAGVVVGEDGLLGGLGDDAEPARSAPQPTLNTSEWEPGDAAMQALGGGTLAVSDDGCVHADVGEPLDIVWPAGYAATREPDGTVVVRRADGQVVAVEGERFSAGGGGFSAAEGGGGRGLEWACRAPGSAGGFVIHEAMEPIEPTSAADLNTARDSAAFDGGERIDRWLFVSPDNCLHLRTGHAGSSVQDVVFPLGYYATEDAGQVAVHHPNGEVVAREGERFVSSGGTGDPPDGMTCRVSDGDVIYARATRPLDVVTIEVPDVVGMTEYGARAEVEAAGLDVGVRYDPGALDEGAEPGSVVAQDPEPGSQPSNFDRVTLTVAAPDPEPTDSDRALATAFASFAEAPGTGAVPFADQVLLGLGAQEVRVVSADSLGDPAAWEFRVSMFAGRGPGTFSALRTLADVDGDWTARVGPHPTCSGGASTPIPARLRELRQIALQPRAAPGGCLDSFSVDLFVDDQGDVRGVVLDLWEP